MVTVRGISQYPWADNTTPSTNGQYPLFIGCGNEAYYLQVPRAFNTGIVFYQMALFESGSENQASSTGAVSIIAPYGSSGSSILRTGIWGISNPKGTTPINIGSQLWDGGGINGGSLTQLCTLYAPTTPALQAYTDNGKKYIATGGNPETDWAGAIAWTNQNDSCVYKVTMTNATTLSHFFLAISSAIAGGTGNEVDVFCWNFDTDTWDAAQFRIDHGGFPRTEHQSGYYTSAQHINGSKEMYVRVKWRGSGVASSVAAPKIVYGDKNPQD